MKEIPLTQGRVALVDDEDYEGLAKWKWCYHKPPTSKTGYARRSKCEQGGKQVAIFMHRVILKTPRGYETDHINGDGLDNSKKNLRVATPSQNQWNKGKRQDNTSGFKGVSWHKGGKKWRAYIRLKVRQINLGYFTDKLEAARAYNEAAIKYHGEFSAPNKGERW